jgi:hypothetical protein
MVVRGGEDRERKSFPEAAGKKAPRVAGCDDPFNSLPYQLGSRWRDWRPTVTGLKSSGEELTKQCWFGHRGQCGNRQRRRNRQSRQNRLTVSLDRLDSPRLDKKDCWSGHYWGSGSHANRGGIGSAYLCSCRFVGEKRQRRFFDEHGLDDGLSRPCRKIRPGDTLTKQRWFRHWGSGSPRDSVGRFGSSVCFGSVGLLARWADASADSGSAQ